MRLPFTVLFAALVAAACAVNRPPAAARLSVDRSIATARNDQRRVLDTFGAPHVILVFPVANVTRWIYCRPRKAPLVVDFDFQGAVILQAEMTSAPGCWRR